jgi:hypothetical protein
MSQDIGKADRQLTIIGTDIPSSQYRPVVGFQRAGRFIHHLLWGAPTWKRAIKTKMGSCDVELFTPLQPAEPRVLQDAVERSSRFLDLPVTASSTTDRISLHFLVRT